MNGFFIKATGRTYPNGFSALEHTEVLEVEIRSDDGLSFFTREGRDARERGVHFTNEIDVLGGYYFSTREKAEIGAAYLSAKSTYKSGFVNEMFIPRSNRAEKTMRDLEREFSTL